MQDNEATVAQVKQQVLGLERGHAELRQDLHGVEQKMDRGFAAVDSKIAAGFQAVAAKLDEKTTPQWQAYGVIAMVLIPICGALVWPIREQGLRNERAADLLMEKTIKLTHDFGYLDGQLHPIIK